MSFKIPCGGFRLDENSFSLDENGVLSVSGGNESVKTVNGITPDEKGNVEIEIPKFSDYFGGAPGEIKLDWDGSDNGQDTFVAGAATFYKISDLVFSREEVTNGSITVSSGAILSNFVDNTGCFGIGQGVMQIVFIPEKGNYKIASFEFTAPSAGIYFGKTSGWYIEEAKFNAPVPDSALYLNSNSGKRFQITVDDSGTITATEVT